MLPVEEDDCTKTTFPAAIELGVGTFSQLTDLWVFGYGSILWNTGFGYAEREVGYVRGYARKFWQGNTTHRGTPQSPGRVATLVKEPENRAWGMAYHLTDARMVVDCLDHLGLRECVLGGYCCRLLPFRGRSCPQTPTPPCDRRVLAFVAAPCSPLFLGALGLDELAGQVVACRGASGTNVEYVLRLAEFVRENIPEDRDEHLFELERKVRERLCTIDGGHFVAETCQGVVNSDGLRDETCWGVPQTPSKLNEGRVTNFAAAPSAVSVVTPITEGVDTGDCSPVIDSSVIEVEKLAERKLCRRRDSNESQRQGCSG